MIAALLHGLAHVLGLDDLAGPFYGFWSGFGSDLSELALLGAAYGLWRRHNCHVKGCWRIGRLPVEGTPHVVCQRHHPRGQPTHQQVHLEHAARRRRA